MAFTDTSKANYAFKALLGKAHTSSSREIANETLKSGVTAIASRIWADTIPLSGASAVAAGVAVFVPGLVLEIVSGAVISSVQVSYRLKLPGAVPAGLVGKINPATGMVYASGDYVASIIPESYGIVGASDFRPILKENGTEIPPLDSSDWFLDPFAGIVTREADGDSLSRVWASPLTMDAYIYCGNTVTDYITALISLSGSGSGISEAPINGQIYARQNGAWTAITSGGSSTGSSIVVNSISAGSISIIGSGGTSVSTDLNTKIITISSNTTVDTSQFGTILTGQIDIITGQDTFTVTHINISGSSYPLVSMVVPNSAAPLYIQSISNTSTSGFDIILSGIATKQGYKINWQRAVSGYINVGVLGGSTGETLIAYDETPSGGINGINQNFYLSTTPFTNSLLLYNDGIRQSQLSDYNITGSSITFNSAPVSGSSLRASYWAPAPQSLADIAGHIAQENPHIQYALKLNLLSTTTTSGSTSVSSQYNCYVFTGTNPHSLNLKECVTNTQIIIKNRSLGNVTITPSGSDTIDGSSNFILDGGTNSAITLIGNSTDWIVL